MRSAILIIVLTLLCSTPLMAQGTDSNLRSELEALHAKWFKAFDSGDGATMDQMEMDNLTLVIRGYGNPHWHSQYQISERDLARGDDGGVRTKLW